MALLVCLLLLAASIAPTLSSDVVHIKRIGQLRSERWGGSTLGHVAVTGDPSRDHRFHQRDPDIPNVKRQDFKTTVKCTKERQDLAKELDRLIAEKDKLDAQCATDLGHYQDMNSVTQQQIERLKPMVAERKDESDLPPLYNAQYTAIMCAKLHDGFVMDGEKARAEVMHICNGNKSLTECKLESRDPFGGGSSYETEVVDWTGHYNLPSKLASHFLQHRPSSGHEELESPECFQAKAVQEQVDSTKKSTKSKADHCSKEERKLKVDLEKKRKAEDALWTEYHGHISQKGPIRKKEAEKVKTKFCAAVQRNHTGAIGCHKDRRSAIEEFYGANCLPSLAASSDK